MKEREGNVEEWWVRNRTPIDESQQQMKRKKSPESTGLD
jgi:hypothetical protein